MDTRTVNVILFILLVVLFIVSYTKSKNFVSVYIVLAIITIYNFYVHLWINGRQVVFEEIINASSVVKVDGSKFKLNHHNNGFALTNTFWIYIQDWNHNYMNEKPIYTKDKLRVYLGKVVNDLIIDVPVYNSDPKNDKTYIIEKVVVNNVPLQRWLQITIIFDNRNLDIWVNDALYSSKLLSNIPLIDDGASLDLTPNSGFGGYIGKFYVYDKPISKRFIKRSFALGPFIGAPYEFFRKIYYYFKGKTIEFVDSNATVVSLENTLNNAVANVSNTVANVSNSVSVPAS